MPRFTVRDLFWLVLVVALALGWWRDRRTGLVQRDDRIQLLTTQLDSARDTNRLLVQRLNDVHAQLSAAGIAAKP